MISIVSSLKKSTGAQSLYYPDVRLFLILIPIISGINYYLTYSKLELGWYLAFRYTIDTVQGYVAWYAVRQLILYLDKKMPYERNFAKRIVVQFVTATMLGLFIIIITTEILSYLVLGEWAKFSFYTLDVIIIGIWFFFINSTYLGLYYYNKVLQVEINHKTQNKLKEEGFLIKVGQKEVKIHFDDIIGFSADRDYIVVYEKGDKQYYVDDSLKKIEGKIPDDIFFRLNRRFILNRSVISGFKRIENGKILILLHQEDIFSEKIIVSRTKAPLFKDWFRAC